ncbi:MAG: sulfurtransferase TusA family protein [Hahellaceae bacterium]|nr:sulfurtransferase TusA family protein [Hahellaceae bacterium]
MQADHILDLGGLRCPMPLLKTKQRLAQIKPGERLLVTTTDSGSKRDIPSYLRLSEHVLEDMTENADTGQFLFLIVKGARTNVC